MEKDIWRDPRTGKPYTPDEKPRRMRGDRKVFYLAIFIAILSLIVYAVGHAILRGPKKEQASHGTDPYADAVVTDRICGGKDGDGQAAYAGPSTERTAAGSEAARLGWRPGGTQECASSRSAGGAEALGATQA